MTISLGIGEYNVMIKDIGHVTFEFFVVLMYLLHSIQQIALEEMKERDSGFLGQLKTSKKTITSLKNIVKERERE